MASTSQSINFTHYDLKEQRADTVVEITLSAIANVRLMTDANFKLYKQAAKHQFLGGVAKKSPLRLAVPASGHWHLVVDMQGLNGLAQSKIRVIDAAPAQRAQSAG